MPTFYVCRQRTDNERAHKWPNAVASIRVIVTGSLYDTLEAKLQLMKVTYPNLFWVFISKSCFVEYPAGYAQFRIDAAPYGFLFDDEN